MSFEILAGLASEWAALLPDRMINDGPAKLLAMSRSQFAYSWFNYEFMVTACLTGLQALEAAFRVLYPEAERTPFVRSSAGHEQKVSFQTPSPSWQTQARSSTTASRIPRHRRR